MKFSELLGWPKSSFGFFCKTLLKNPNKLLGQPNTYLVTSSYFLILTKNLHSTLLIIHILHVWGFFGSSKQHHIVD